MYTALKRRSDLCIPRNETERHRFLEIYIYRSQIHECRYWERGPAVSFLGIFVSNFQYSVFAVCGCFSVNWAATSVPDPWHVGVDPDTDPRIHDSDKWIRMRIRMRIRLLLFSSLTLKRRGQQKKNIFYKVFLLITFWRYIYIIFQRQKAQKKSKNSRNQGYSYSFCLMIEGSGPYLWLVDPDPDPGGPKRCGSVGSGSAFGSGTLTATMLYRIYFWPSLPLTLSQRRLFAVILFTCNMKSLIYNDSVRSRWIIKPTAFEMT